MFLIGLDNNRYLYGIPYLVLGLLIIGGVAASQRRVRRRAEAEEKDRADPQLAQSLLGCAAHGPAARFEERSWRSAPAPG